MPALKQKTGIIKSKVPPPVPPRGSPRDRRSGNGNHKSSLSPRGTPPSSGSVNYLNDKYFDLVRPNRQISQIKKSPGAIPKAIKEPMMLTALVIRPVFGERRSPTCVRDWLEVNDFDANEFDRKIVAWTRRGKAAAKARHNQMQIKESILQRDNSFKNISNSSGSVKSLTEKFDPKNEPSDGQPTEATDQTEKEPSRDFVTSRVATFTRSRGNRRGQQQVQLTRLNWMPGGSELDDEFCASSKRRRNVVYDSRSRKKDYSPMPDFIKRASLYDDYKEAELIFNTLQPPNGRHGFGDDSFDSTKRFKIIEALSNLDVNDNFSSQCLENFSIEGEFV